MYAIATFLLVALITMIVTRLATGALIATGLPAPIARFQARSAYSGTGFTTTESENVVNHPIRRRVLYTLMMVGSLGTPTLVVTIVIGFVAPGPGDTLERLGGLLVAMVLLLLAMSIPPVTRGLERLGHRYGDRRIREALAHEAEELVDLGDGFVVSRIPFVETPGEQAIRSLRAMRSHLSDVDVLGILQADGDYLGRSPTDIDLRAGDALVVYGRREDVRRLIAETPSPSEPDQGRA